MSDCCDHDHSVEASQDPRFRKALWIALILNATMFFVEFFWSVQSSSASLTADAIDFFGDSVNYALSLSVLHLALKKRARVSLAKGITMFVYGLFVLFLSAKNAYNHVVPEAHTMEWIGSIAFVVNLSVALILYKFRNGDSNMQSVWLCTRNDALGNIAVIFAAIAVKYFGSGWPDYGVAFFMASLGLSAGLSVIKSSLIEIKS
jgi:Co/Zn/Cd efflux system component